MAKLRNRRIRALARLAAQTSNRASVIELAETIHYSPSHLRMLFRHAHGEPFARSQRRQRLDAIAARLVQAPSPLAPLARKAGYASTEALNHAFKARFGRAPSVLAASPEPVCSNPRALGIGLALARHFATSGVRIDG